MPQLTVVAPRMVSRLTHGVLGRTVTKRQVPNSTECLQRVSACFASLMASITGCEDGAALWPVALGCGRRALGTAPTLQSCDRVGKHKFGILEDERCIDTGVFQRRYLVHELVFACSPPPPPRRKISGANWRRQVSTRGNSNNQIRPNAY